MLFWEVVEAAILSEFHEEFVEPRPPASPIPFKFLKFVLEHLLRFSIPREDINKRRRHFSKAQVNTMYGDPFVSLFVAVLFGIVFYNLSSIPNGQEHNDIEKNAAHVRK